MQLCNRKPHSGFKSPVTFEVSEAVPVYHVIEYLEITGLLGSDVAINIFEPWHEISYNFVCATSKGSDQPAHTRSLIRAFATRSSIL